MSKMIFKDYRDLSQLDKTDLYDKMKQSLVITASKDLSNALQFHYKNAFQSVYDIAFIIENVIPEWKNNIKNITNYIRLRNVVEQYIDERTEGGCISAETIQCLRRNTSEMLKAIELLIESNVYPQDIKNLKISRYLEYFAEIWRRFERDNREIMAFRTALDYNLFSEENVKSKIKSAVAYDSKVIFLVGFYYITAIQKRLFTTLMSSGYTLIFLNDHDYDHSFFTAVWENTYNIYSGKIECFQKDIIQNNVISDTVNGNCNKNAFNLVKHNSEFEFAEMIEEALKNKGVLYSPDDKRANSILEKLLPEKLKKRHLLSYPVGQYIYYLHLMWDSDESRLNYSFEYVFKCFSSGWLTEDELNGRDYLYHLKTLRPYLNFKSSPDQWLSVIDDMIAARLDFHVSRRSDSLKAKLDTAGNLIGSLYLIDEQEYECIKRLFLKLKSDAEMLFTIGDAADDKNRIDIYSHFKKIKEIINSRIGNENIIEDEIEAANELLKKLSVSTSSGMKCTLSGVKDAIMLMLGGGLSDEEEDEDSYLVRPFGKIDAALLNRKKLYILLADEFSLPGKHDEYPWPLNEKNIEDIYGHLTDDRGSYLKTTISVMKSKPLSSRYLFFKIINQCRDRDITIEWICRNNDRYVEVSPYVSALNNAAQESDNDYLAVSLDKSLNIPEVFTSVNEPDKTLPAELHNDYELCKYRYIYSYILNDIPSFTAPFHFNFLYPRLINYYDYLGSSTHKDIYLEKLKKVIPIERQVEITEAEDHIPHYDFIKPDHQTARLHRHYLYVRLVNFIKNNDQENIAKYRCVYCPYNTVCLSREQ